MNNVGEFLETIYDVIFKPKEAFQKFAQTPQILQACLVVFITTTLSLIAISAGSGGVSYRGGPVSYTHLDVYKRQRLSLVKAVQNTIRHALNILGVSAPEKM